MKRRYRVVMECEVEVNDLTYDATIAKYDERERRWRDASVPDWEQLPLPTPENVEDQATLLAAILADPARLDRYMRNEVMSHLDGAGLEATDPKDDYVDILRPLIEKLPPRARHRFRESIARDTLVETAEEFLDCFETTIVSVKVE